MDHSEIAGTLDVTVRVAQIIGALTGLVALLVSCQALRTSRLASALKDRPLLYLRPGEYRFVGSGPSVSFSQGQMPTQGLPLDKVSLAQHRFALRSASQVPAERVHIARKWRVGSIEREKPLNDIEFFPPDEQVFFTHDIAEDEFKLMCPGVPLVLFLRTTYQDVYGRDFHTDQFFRLDLAIVGNTLREAVAASISRESWERASGDSLKIGRLGTFVAAPGTGTQ